MNSLTKIAGLLGVSMGFSSLGCLQQPYTDVRLAYANAHHEKDLGGGVDMLCVKARVGAKVGTKEPSEAEILERRDLILRKIKNQVNSYFRQHPDDPRKKDWSTVLELEKEGGKIVLKQECDGKVYFGLDGISLVQETSTQDYTNNVLDLAERIPNYAVSFVPGTKLEQKNYAFEGLPAPMGLAEKCNAAQPFARQEVRFGVDICHGSLPPETSIGSYTLDVPVAGKKETYVYGMTRRSLEKVSIPLLEYKYGSLEANIPSQVPAHLGLRSPYSKDISLGLWAALGYEIDFTVSKTDYYLLDGVVSGGMLNNIPGLEVKGRFYGELTNEVVLFGKVPLGMSVRADKNGDVTPLFSGGYRAEW